MARRHVRHAPTGKHRFTDLLDILSRIAISIDLAPTLDALLTSLQELIPFDAAGIFVVDADRRVLRARATRGYAAGLEVPVGAGVVGTVIASGRPHLVPDVRTAADYIEVRPSTRSQLAVPLLSGHGVIGAISMEADRVNEFSSEDLNLVILFAQQAAVAIQRTMLHERMMQQSYVEREIEVAAEIVRGLTPTVMPAVPGIEVYGRSRGASSVGGDVFDFLPYPDSQLGVAIADPRGKGIPAALLAVAHQSTLRALVSMELRLTSMFTRMSRLLEQSMPAGAFVTAFYGIVDARERRMVYANAGHPPALVIRHRGTSEWLPATGAALGFPQLGSIGEGYVNLEPGDGIVLFTDGVTEAGPHPEAFFEPSGVEAAARNLWSLDASAIGDGIFDAVLRHADGHVTDDATIVVVKCAGA